nr:retropepsin-like aspartic protease [uncultured Psychroserpens sp.]
MKKIIYIILGFVFTNCYAQTQHINGETFKSIDSLISVKSYFKARNLFNSNKAGLSEFEHLHTKATLNNLFNKLEISNQAIDLLFSKYQDSLTKSEQKDLLNVRLSNAIKLFDYKLAHETTKRIIIQYRDVLSKSELRSLRNNGIIWEAIADFPKQTIVKTDASTIKLSRDAIGLKNLNVKRQNKNFPFIFDTGANISTVIESRAKAMGLDIIDVSVKVGSITGAFVNSKIGFAKEMTIANISFKNVIFLVFPDEALYIPQVKHQIEGVLGFPVISAMKEVHFYKNDHVYVPKESHYKKEVNMAIEYLTPIINLKDKKGHSMHFTFDTGASTTALYKTYYDLVKRTIDKTHTKSKIKFSGAGGSTEVDAYKVDFDVVINGEMIVLPSVSLIPELITYSDQYSYGNIGQDLISRFDKLIMNFENMFIDFQNNPE